MPRRRRSAAAQLSYTIDWPNSVARVRTLGQADRKKELSGPLRRLSRAVITLYRFVNGVILLVFSAPVLVLFIGYSLLARGLRWWRTPPGIRVRTTAVRRFYHARHIPRGLYGEHEETQYRRNPFELRVRDRED